jgi:hypothetical protein
MGATQPGFLIQENAGLASKQRIGLSPEASLALRHPRVAPDEIGHVQAEMGGKSLAIVVADGDPLIQAATGSMAIEAVIFDVF